MKKPRKSKPKKRHSAGQGHHGPRSVSPAAHRIAKLTAPRHRPVVRWPVSAFAATYNADDRQTLALIALPLFLMAFAIAASQAARTMPGLGDLVTSRSRLEGSAPRAEEARERIRRQEITAQKPVALAPVARESGLEIAAAREGPAESLHAVHAPDSEARAADTRQEEAPKEIPAARTEAPVARQPALPHEAQSAGNAGRVEVAALDVQSETPGSMTPLTEGAREPAGAGAMCVAGENAKMRRNVRLGALVPATDPEAFGSALAAAAREQLDDFVIYTDKYHRMSYPLGDIPALYGVCTDVIIRAYHAVGFDLQRLVHESRVGSGDSNIDHRRVDTLKRFFAKYGETLPITEFAEDYKPGDIVTYYRPQNRHSRSHIAIVSDVYAASGRPMIIHNRGWGPQQEDALFVDEITGRFRFNGAKLPPAPAVPAVAEEPVKSKPAGQPARARGGGTVKTSLAPSSGARKKAALR